MEFADRNSKTVLNRKCPIIDSEDKLILLLDPQKGAINVASMDKNVQKGISDVGKRLQF